MIKTNAFRPSIKTSSRNQEISRLLSAAVINNHFRAMLLSDPEKAAANGYAGESFSLDRKELIKISAINASSLSEFAAQLAAI